MKKRKPKENMYYYVSRMTDGIRGYVPVKPIWMIEFPEFPNYIFFLYLYEDEGQFHVVEGSTGLSVSSYYHYSQKSAIESAESNLLKHKDIFARMIQDHINKYGTAPDPIERND